jgi:hypothetical protein
VLFETIRLSKKLGLSPHWVNLQNKVFGYATAVIAQPNHTPVDGQQKILNVLENICSEINIDLSVLKREIPILTK